MKVGELIKKLKSLSQDDEVVLAINHSCGFKEADYIEIYPVESVYEPTKEEKDIMIGYTEKGDNFENLVMLYVFP